MTDKCPVCGESPHMTGANFCGNCGEPLDVEVDREWIRQQATGFLRETERRMLHAEVTGEREHRHEFTVAMVEESFREALTDFWLVNWWSPFEPRSALPSIQEDVEDGQVLLLKLLCLQELIYRVSDPDTAAALLAAAMWNVTEIDDDRELDVGIFLDNERINEDVELYLKNAKTE